MKTVNAIVCGVWLSAMLGACTSAPASSVKIPEYTSSEKSADSKALGKLRASLAARGFRFENEGRRWEMFYPQNRPLTEDERSLLGELVTRSDRYLNRYNRDHRIDGRLIEAKPLETNEIRQERTLARRLLEKGAAAPAPELARPSESFLKPTSREED